jgi:hypothetical protein
MRIAHSLFVLDDTKVIDTSSSSSSSASSQQWIGMHGGVDGVNLYRDVTARTWPLPLPLPIASTIATTSTTTHNTINENKTVTTTVTDSDPAASSSQQTANPDEPYLCQSCRGPLAWHIVHSSSESPSSSSKGKNGSDPEAVRGVASHSGLVDVNIGLDNAGPPRRRGAADGKTKASSSSSTATTGSGDSLSPSSTRPSKRLAHTMTRMGSMGNRYLLYGGVCPQPLNDTWVLTLTPLPLSTVSTITTK